MNRFWIVLGVVIIGLVGIFVLTKPKDNGSSSFTGDAKQIQADDHKKGNTTNPKVTLIEYGDFQCPSCGAVYPIVEQVTKKYEKDLQFVFRHFPLISIHANAFSAARAAEAAGKQNKFWEMYSKLYESQDLWSQLTTNQQSTFEGYAKELGLDMTKFKADYVSEETANRINRDVSSGKQFDIQGTPTFIVNGQKIENPRDAAGFEKIIQDAIANSAKN